MPYTGTFANINRAALNKPKAEDWMETELKKQYETERFSGFLPDEGLYKDAFQADMDQIMAALPIAGEEFNANLAARGMFGAGEAPAAYYRDVVAPVAREATSAASKYNLAYQQQYQQGRMAEEQLRRDYLSQYINYKLQLKMMEIQKQIAKEQGQGGFWGGVTDIAGAAVGAIL